MSEYGWADTDWGATDPAGAWQHKYEVEREKNAALAARLAEAEKDATRSRHEWQRECEDTDLLLQGMGLCPSEYRSECGSLLLARIRHKMGHIGLRLDETLARLAEVEAERDKILRLWLDDADPAECGYAPDSAPAVETKLWLWRNGDHFLAFEHLYPCFTPGGDPMTLGEPVGYAIVKRSFDRAPDSANVSVCS